jgi:hypothetical protein
MEGVRNTRNNPVLNELPEPVLSLRRVFPRRYQQPSRNSSPILNHPVTNSGKILPILENHCYDCHGEGGKNKWFLCEVG